MIVFENKGLIPIEAFSTFGVNVKPNTDNPIGFFGTGLKYAVAVCLRLGGTFTLKRGEDEYVFYLKTLDFRGKEFQQVRMRRKRFLATRWSYHDLPFTTELGKHWKPWMAVRELESNVRDENGSSFIGKGKIYLNQPDWTQIIIDCKEMEDAFREDKTQYTIFMNKFAKLIHEDENLQIFEGSADYIYYRGLRVTDLGVPSLYTYNFLNNFDLTEDRTAKYPHWNNMLIVKMLMSLDNQAMVEKIIDCPENECFEGSLDFDRCYAMVSTTFTAVLGMRVATGANIPRRIKSYYDSLHRDDGIEAKHAIYLTEAQIKEVMDEFPPDDLVHIACVNALERENIPF